MKNLFYIVFSILLLSASCVTTKKSKQEVGFIGKKYHDMTARYNGYFNAKEIYAASLKKLDESKRENYNQILPVFPFDQLDDHNAIAADMDKVIEKVTKVAALHEPSKWVDDCYVLMGKAQYLKGDFESSQETFEYFVAEFNPKDPDSRVYESPNLKETAKDRKKEAENERKIQDDLRKKEKEDKAKQREKEKKEREEARKQRQKDRKKGIRTETKPAEEAEQTPPDNKIVANAGNDVPIDPDEAYIRQLEQESKNAREKEVAKTNSGGFLKHKPAYYEGILGLIKTYLARERWLEANYYMDQLEKEEGLESNIKEELPLLRSDYFLRQKQYNLAIPSLQKAILESGDKKQKARCSFILAQIYQLTGNSSEAYTAFENVSKYSPDFELALNARINMLRNSSSANKDSGISELEKMAGEEKYKNYKSAIYFTLAEIALADGKNEEAMNYFNLALQSGDAGANKSEIYYRLATLFMGRQNYVEAKNYFDSTSTTMLNTDERYAEVSRLSRSLKEIAKNLQILSEQDSLLILANMTEEELYEYAKAKVIKEWEENNVPDAIESAGGFTATTSVISSNSRFFAYNQVTRQKGHQDFQKKWGDRQLVDNWRINRAGNDLLEEEKSLQVSQTIPQAELEREINKITREVPKDESGISAIHSIIEKALFDLGTGYRSYLYKYQESNETMGRLLEKFPDTKYKVEAYFYFYLNYLDLNDENNANHYLNLIFTQFPDSDFARYLRDPSGDNVLMTKERKIERYYDLSYALFEKSEYASCQKRLEEAKGLFGTNHHMTAKYELLNAMCMGHTKGSEEYVNALRSVILRFENTPEQTYARELLRFLSGDSEAFGGEIGEDELKDFALEDDKLHYIIIILYDADGNAANEVKDQINTYNDKYFESARLRSTSVYLNEEIKTHLILMRRFNNKQESMDYYRHSSLRPKEFIDKSKYAYDIFAINTRNYREVIKQKSVKAYRVFFDRNYISNN